MTQILIDPLTEPWSGTAVHGNTRFSTTLISHIEGNLWLGGCLGGVKLPDDFEYVVSLYPWEQYALGQGTERIELRLLDAEMGDEAAIRKVASQAADCIRKGKTLIHCQAGLNRSSLVAVLALNQLGMAIPDAIRLLREKRSPACLCNRNFEEWLLAL